MSLNTNLPYVSNSGTLLGQFLTLNVTGGASFSVDSNGTATLALPATGVTSLTGTANQISVSASTGAVTLSLPQNLIIPAPSSGVSLQVNVNNATYPASDSVADSAIIINNTNSAMQTMLDFTKSGVLSGRIRSDYVGNLNYATTGSGVHAFFVGGDSGVGGAAFYITSTGQIQRQTPACYMDGGYSTVETGGTAGCIYTIGSASYRPNTTSTNALGTMYGIGYTYSNTTNGNGTTIASTTGVPASKWGMYTSAAGVARIFLDADDGNIYSSGSHTGNFGTLTSPSSYGSLSISSSTGGYAGIQFGSTTNLRTLMVSNTGGISGIYDVGSSAWEWYWTNGTLTQGTIPAANVSGTVASATLASTVTSTNTTFGYAIDVALINGTSIQYSANFSAVPSTGVMTAAGGFTVSSDRNKKDNIRLITNAEEIVQSLSGVKFYWKSNGLPSVGVIAQDVEAVLPELVQTDDAGTKSVNYNGLIGVLIEAVKSLTERVAQLEAK